jgi:hypothetical protein
LSVDGYLGRRAEHDLTALATALEPVALASNIALRVEGSSHATASCKPEALSA